jgi:hypothetical protein
MEPPPRVDFAQSSPLSRSIANNRNGMQSDCVSRQVKR